MGGPAKIELWLSWLSHRIQASCLNRFLIDFGSKTHPQILQKSTLQLWPMLKVVEFKFKIRRHDLEASSKPLRSSFSSPKIAPKLSRSINIDTKSPSKPRYPDFYQSDWPSRRPIFSLDLRLSLSQGLNLDFVSVFNVRIQLPKCMHPCLQCFEFYPSLE